MGSKGPARAQAVKHVVVKQAMNNGTHQDCNVHTGLREYERFINQRNGEIMWHVTSNNLVSDKADSGSVIQCRHTICSTGDQDTNKCEGYKRCVLVPVNSSRTIL